MDRPIALCALVLTVPGFVRADGLVHRLPADGTWARYAHTSKLVLGGKELETKGKITIASVGRAKADGEECRWLEFVIEVALPNGKGIQKSVFKGLLAEKHLAAGGNPSGRWLKGWARLGEGEVRALTPAQLANPALKLNLFVTGPLQDLKKLPKKTVATGLGELACTGESGRLVLKGASVTIKDGMASAGDAHLHVSNYFHDRAPFGVALTQLRLEGEGQKQVSVETLTLEAVGTGAKSLLPMPASAPGVE